MLRSHLTFKCVLGKLTVILIIMAADQRPAHATSISFSACFVNFSVSRSDSLNPGRFTDETHGVSCPDSGVILSAFATAFHNQAFPISSTSNENISVTVDVTGTFGLFSDDPKENGKTRRVVLLGALEGSLFGRGIDFQVMNGSYGAAVEASVDVGFASWQSPGLGHSISGSFLAVGEVDKPVTDKIRRKGSVVIGETYDYSATLVVEANKQAGYIAKSDFDDTLQFSVVVPEPATIGLVGIGLIGVLGRARFRRR